MAKRKPAAAAAEAPDTATAPDATEAPDTTVEPDGDTPISIEKTRYVAQAQEAAERAVSATDAAVSQVLHEARLAYTDGRPTGS